MQWVILMHNAKKNIQLISRTQGAHEANLKRGTSRVETLLLSYVWRKMKAFIEFAT